ncbi:ubiquitin carboxyl-terminal hydrolase 48-like isoform X2 [Vespula maculifrons]
MLARVEQERLESLKYDKAVIYIKCVDDSDDSKAELTTENREPLIIVFERVPQVAAKRPKMDSSRPSRTRRKVKGSHELKVSSEITLKELKVMTADFGSQPPLKEKLWAVSPR